MSGQNDDFMNTIMAATNKIPISITCEPFEQEVTDEKTDKVKKCWCISFMLTGDGFNISKVIEIGHTESARKKAYKISESIISWYNSYNVLKDAFKITLNNITNEPVKEWQVDILNQAKEIVKE